MPTNEPDVRYCATAVIDLLGFSAHLETGGNDVRTTIGRQAITRLEILEEAIRLMSLELSAVPIAYPKELSYERINDAIILSLDLPDFITPSVGQIEKGGFSVGDILQNFDMNLYDGEEGEQRFEADLAARFETAVEDLIKFVGLVARLHSFVNIQEHERAFPGAKTVCVTGLRRRFKKADGREDPLAANFSFANACVASRSLHGAGVFVDDAIARLVSINAFALNLIRHACFVNRSKEFDPAKDHQREPYLESERVLSSPQRVELFRRVFVFREMTAGPLTYLQEIHLLSEYLTGTREPARSKSSSIWSAILECIRTGPDPAALREGTAPPPRLTRNDISCDIRVFPELLESGSSPTAEAKQQEEILRGSTHFAVLPGPGRDL